MLSLLDQIKTLTNTVNDLTVQLEREKETINELNANANPINIKNKFVSLKNGSVIQKAYKIGHIVMLKGVIISNDDTNKIVYHFSVDESVKPKAQAYASLFRYGVSSPFGYVYTGDDGKIMAVSSIAENVEFSMVYMV